MKIRFGNRSTLERIPHFKDTSEKVLLHCGSYDLLPIKVAVTVTVVLTYLAKLHTTVIQN